MKKNLLETILGFCVIITAILFAVFIYYNAHNSYKDRSQGYYTISAKFQNVSGIIQGSDIMLAGIKIGEVASMTLDTKTFEAIVNLNIKDDILLPSDSRASIISAGIVGNKFISIEPGSEATNLNSGDKIIYTSSAVNLEGLIGKFIYSIGNKSSK